MSKYYDRACLQMLNVCKNFLVLYISGVKESSELSETTEERLQTACGVNVDLMEIPSRQVPDTTETK